MKTIQLSKRRNINLPKFVCKAYHLNKGEELEIELTPQGILLKPKKIQPTINIDDIAGCLAYQGKPKTIEEMNDAIRQGIIAEWGKHEHN